MIAAQQVLRFVSGSSVSASRTLVGAQGSCAFPLCSPRIKRACSRRSRKSRRSSSHIGAFPAIEGESYGPPPGGRD